MCYHSHMTSVDFENFQSPFSWRYASLPMRKIFSEKYKFQTWRKIWVALAKVQHKAGLVSKKELEDLISQEKNIDIEEILEIEKKTKHDVVAAIWEFAAKAKVGGGKIHLGATSMDIVDNADMIRFTEALGLIEDQLKELLKILSELIKKHADTPSMGYTHLQPAEPTTVGYRLSIYAQDLLIDLNYLSFVKSQLVGKGMKGAVGTRASYKSVLEGKAMDINRLDESVMSELGLKSALVSTQVYPRKLDFLIISLLSSIGSSCAKFAGDLRILQSPLFGEWSEPFGKNQVGSSAMPFKKNPITSEKICSLARYLQNLPAVLLENATLSYLERTLDDSSNKRLVMPQAFLALDEIMQSTKKIFTGLIINKKKISDNLETYAPFSAAEVLMMRAVKNGGDRQKIHEVLRKIAMDSWRQISEGKPNPMKDSILDNKFLAKFLSKKEIENLFDITSHVGDAPERARMLCKEINGQIVQRAS